MKKNIHLNITSDVSFLLKETQRQRNKDELCSLCVLVIKKGGLK